MFGKVKIECPGTGTPIITAINSRKAITAIANFAAQLKLSDQGPSDLKNLTSSARITMTSKVIQALCKRTKVVARSALHSHHANGCKFLISTSF